MFAQCVAVVRSVLQSVAVACHEYVMHTFAFVPLLLPPSEKKGAGKSLCNFLLQCVAVICRLCEKGKRPRKYGAYTQRVRIFTCGTTVTWLVLVWHDSFVRDMTHSYVICLIHTRNEVVIGGMTHSYRHHERGAHTQHGHVFTCDMTHSHATWLIYTRHDSFMCDMTYWYVTCFIHTWHNPFIHRHRECGAQNWHGHLVPSDMTHSYVKQRTHGWHDSSMCDMTDSYVKWRIDTWSDSFICDMSHSYVKQRTHGDSFICDMPHSYVKQRTHGWHDSFMCDMTDSYVKWHIYTWSDSFICDKTHLYVKHRTHVWHDAFMCDMTDSYVKWRIYTRSDSFICNMTHSYTPRKFGAHSQHGPVFRQLIRSQVHLECHQ